MKIVQLRASNVKRLKAVEITPDGNLVVISGRNGQGKSSVLDAIWFALGGKDSMRATARPIRDGETHAEVSLDLGDLVVTRRWTADDKTTLKVATKDGARYDSPQAVLDALVGRLSFDPLAFMSMDERKQVQTLLDLVELPIDPAALDAERATLYDERTAAGRVLKRLEGQFASMPEPPEGTPAEEVRTSDLLAESQAALAVKSANDAKRAQVTEVRRALETVDGQVRDAEAKLAELRALQTRGVAKLSALEAEVAGLTDPDFDGLNARVLAAEETNRWVRAASARRAVAEELAAARADVDRLTAAIGDIDTRKEQAIREARMPVEGLGFDAHGVTYRGLPLKQASSAEQLRVSVAMAMALNPKLRVIRITDGSLLDSENMRLLAEMADTHDCQVWVEKVDDTGSVGVHIEDGMVAEAGPAEPAEMSLLGSA